MEASKTIAKARTHLMFEQPFFGSLALTLEMIETSEIPTMCTDGKSIKYNPEFVQLHSLDEIKGVIAHEVMHVAFQHMLRRGELNPEVWNIATDYAINQIVVDAGMTLPESALLDDQYRGMASETVYNRLIQDPPEDMPEGWNFGEVEEATGEEGQALSEEEVKQMAEEVQVNVLRAHQTAEAMGKVPAGVSDLIKEMSSPKVDWRDKLRAFIGGDQPDDYTWRRPNRKFFGTYGIYMPSVDHVGAGRIVVGVDTSGSVNDEMLKGFLAELNAISEDMSPDSVTVIGCDAEVQSVHEYGEGEVIEDLDCTGRGGTRVSPVFEYIRDNDLPVDSFIYFTDLHVWDFPMAPDYPVLWVSTGLDEAPFGDVVVAKE